MNCERLNSRKDQMERKQGHVELMYYGCMCVTKYYDELDRNCVQASLGFVWTSDRSCAVYWRVGKSRERTAGEITDKNKV